MNTQQRHHTDVLADPFLSMEMAIVSAIVRALLAAIAVKDPDTARHSERVARLAVLIAEELGIPPDRRADIYLMGLLHDIGKLGIADHTLNKTGKLTPEEFAVLQSHVEIGVDLLAGRGLDRLLPGISTHHEREDGHGYPKRLSGREIPLEGKILAVADSADAMAFVRSYRPEPRPAAEIDAILRDGCGSQWDGRVVEAFLARRADVDRLQRELVG